MSSLGKTIQVITFLSAIMSKTGLPVDMERRKKYVSRLQDSEEWKKHRKLPKANEKWPTCLIIAPSTVVHNWEREFETVRYVPLLCAISEEPDSGDTSKSDCISGEPRTVKMC